MKTCNNCQWFWHEGPSFDQPYPEFACTKGHWDGIASEEDEQAIMEETNCKDHENIRTQI